MRAQGKTTSHSIEGWYTNSADSPVLDVTVITRLKGFGYTYVQAKVQSAQITGYYYRGEFYGARELSAYGINFPIKAKNFITNISVVAGIRKRGIGTEYHQLTISSVNKLYSHSEVPFSPEIKAAINSYGQGKGADNWETFGSVTQVDLINPTLSGVYEIKSAIKQYLRNKNRASDNRKENSAYASGTNRENNRTETTTRGNTFSQNTEDNNYRQQSNTAAMQGRVSANRSEASRLNSLGIQAYKNGDYDAAQRYFAKALLLLPNDRNIKANFERAKKKNNESWTRRQQKAMRKAREEEKRDRAEKEKLGRQIGALAQVMFDPERATFEMTRINYNTGYFNSISVDYGGRFDFAGFYARLGLNYTEPDKLVLKNGKKRLTTDIANISLGLGASLFFGSQGGKNSNWSISGLEVTAGFEVAVDSGRDDFKDTMELFYEYGAGYLWGEGSFGFQLSYLIKSYSVGNYQILVPGEREYNDELIYQSLMFSILF